MPRNPFLESVRKLAVDVPRQMTEDLRYIRDRERRMRSQLGQAPLDPYMRRLRTLFPKFLIHPKSPTKERNGTL